MLTKIQKWGNSQGLRVPKAILEEAHMSVGDSVDIKVKDGVLHITRIRNLSKKYRLEDLVAQIPEEHRPEEVPWGKPQGEETW